MVELSVRDGLTKLYNRRHFNQIFEQELRRARRDGIYLSLLMIDVDRFKQYNDTYGHQDGDQVLVSISEVLENGTSRASDYAFRLGGEEFALVFSNLDLQKASKFSQSFRLGVEELGIEHKNNSNKPVVTISMGLITKIPESEMDLQWFYNKADSALYQAKQRGRNQLAIA